MLCKKILLLSAILFTTSHALEDEQFSLEKRFLVALHKYHIADSQRVLNGIVALVPSYFLCKNALELLCCNTVTMIGAQGNPIGSLVNTEVQQTHLEDNFSQIPSFINVGTVLASFIFIYVLGLWIASK